MPKKIDTVVEELNDMIRLAGEPVVTMTWPEFYTLCDISRFKDGRAEDIRTKARDKFGLVVGYGNQAVIVAHDRNFAEFKFPESDTVQQGTRTGVLLVQGAVHSVLLSGAPLPTYAVKEIFLTLQGEGAQAGRAAVFCRFAGCNLWSGREEDRATAQCTFCDTDFVGLDGTKGGRYASAEALAATIAAEWGEDKSERFCVLTGGEPLLQVDEALVAALHAQGFEIAVETNGTVEPPDGLDWICVSPKAANALKITSAHELKLVYPQPEAMPERFANLPFERFSLQPMDGPDVAGNTQAAIAYCSAHPQWRLSVQTHKWTGIR